MGSRADPDHAALIFSVSCPRCMQHKTVCLIWVLFPLFPFLCRRDERDREGFATWKCQCAFPANKPNRIFAHGLVPSEQTMVGSLDRVGRSSFARNCIIPTVQKTE